MKFNNRTLIDMTTLVHTDCATVVGLNIDVGLLIQIVTVPNLEIKLCKYKTSRMKLKLPTSNLAVKVNLKTVFVRDTSRYF